MTPPRAPRATKGQETPPQGTRPTRPTRTAEDAPPTGRKPVTPRLQKKLEEFFATPALLYSFAGDTYAEQIIAQRTPAMAEAWYNLAQQNAGVKRVLERLVESSAWGAVVLSSASVVVPLLQHHGVVPGSDPFAIILGDVTPQARGPIVPPPPAPEGHAPAHGGADNAGEGAGVFSPPVGDAPPGTVTVAGLRSLGADQATEVAA